jgi:hypothetical protein
MEVNGQIIKNISGPVSFRLLKSFNLNYPTIILFGDIHKSKYGKISENIEYLSGKYTYLNNK